MTRSTIQRLRLLTIMVVIGATAGSLYGIIQARPNANSVVELAMGAIIGVVISSFLGGFELFGGPFLERGGRRLSLVAAILVRTTIYGIVIMAALLVVPWMYTNASLSLHRPGLRNAIIFSVVATFVAVPILSIAQLIGPSVLVSFLTGRYYRPREEEPRARRVREDAEAPRIDAHDRFARGLEHEADPLLPFLERAMEARVVDGERRARRELLGHREIRLVVAVIDAARDVGDRAEGAAVGDERDDHHRAQTERAEEAHVIVVRALGLEPAA